MCGINGFNFSDEHLIAQMNKQISHRGPDDHGFFIGQNFSLGHTRLSILDLSAKAHQPMTSDDGIYTIIYNGELYNFLEIKKDLENKGYSFRSNSDTEVILKSYIDQGVACLQKFNGIFAFAIWDKKNKKLFAARDNFGVKPFFYYFKDNKFIFSSEIKSILQYQIDKELDFNSLNLFFRFSYIAGPDTIFKHIKKLSPAHYLTYQDNKLEISRYYQLSSEIKNWDFGEAKQAVREKFDVAVKRQLISDRPLGLFLSGGIDSTAVLGAMSKGSKEKIKTFTVKFNVDVEKEKFNADSELAKKTSAQYQTEHHELEVGAKDVVENIEQVVYHMDDLVSNPTQIATYLLAKMSKEKVAVVLGGDGGDELFGGYERYYYYNLVDRFQKIPSFARDNIIWEKIAQRLHRTKEYQKLNTKDPLDLWWQFRAQPEEKISNFLKKDINNFLAAKDRIRDNYFPKNYGDLASYLMRVDLETWLVDESLTRSDKMSMAFGLEQRVPMLDKDFVELAMSIPAKYKIRSKHQGKYIFKEAVKDYLPDYIYNKPKTGWFSPGAKWLRTDLKDMAYQILSPSYNQDTQDFFDFDEIRKILDDHISKKQYGLNQIWPLLTFQIWYKLFKD